MFSKRKIVRPEPPKRSFRPSAVRRKLSRQPAAKPRGAPRKH